jgi:hypothetical protein
MPLNGPFAPGVLVAYRAIFADIVAGNKTVGAHGQPWKLGVVERADVAGSLVLHGGIVVCREDAVVFDGSPLRAPSAGTPPPMRDRYSGLPVDEQRRRDLERQRAVFSDEPIPGPQAFGFLSDAKRISTSAEVARDEGRAPVERVRKRRPYSPPAIESRPVVAHPHYPAFETPHGTLTWAKLIACDGMLVEAIDGGTRAQIEWLQVQGVLAS